MHASYSPRAFSGYFCVVLVGAVLSLACGQSFAQPASADYTTDLPSVDRVKAEIKGADATDTLARQVAVFTYLQSYIQRIKYNRTVRGPYTPGEEKALTAYSLAAYQISQDYAKSHTPDEAKAFESLHGRYEMDGKFYDDWSTRLIGPQTAAAYGNAEAGLAASAQRQNQRLTQPANPASGGGQSGHSSIGIFGDIADSLNAPQEITPAERRCLELGGTTKQCSSQEFMNGVAGILTGMDGAAAMAPIGNAITLSGKYHNPAALASITFAGQATIADCGRLTDDGFNYTVERNGSNVEVVIDLEPSPIHLLLRSDGVLVGPGRVTIKGRVVSGYLVSEQTGNRIAQYTAAIDSCSIATLNPPPPPKPAPPQEQAPQGGLLGMLTSFMPEADSTPIPPGLRMIGGYSSSGLKLTFAEDRVTLDCGQAHVKAPYTIENTPAQFIIHVQNPGGPFNLGATQPGTLRGSGSTTVNGRLFAGMNGDAATFTPHSESCNVSTFTAMGQATAGSTADSAAPPPSPSPVAPASAPAAASAPPQTNSLASTMAAAIQPPPAVSTRAAMRVLISANFASGANPMAGQAVYVMRERMDSVLRKLGVPVPANATPGQAMETFAAACRSRDCSSVLSGLNSYYVTAAMLDGSGKATLSAQAATGAYFFFALVRTASGSLVWDLPANLVAGDNNVTLTAANAETIKQ